MPSRVDIFRYLDYRSFLKDLVDELRSEGQYSQRSFAKKAGLGSPSYLRMIIQGERNLSPEKAEALCKAFELSQNESEFFFLLVQFDQAKSMPEKDDAYQKILKYQKFKQFHELADEQYQYFNHWYLPAILEALATNWANRTEEVQAWTMRLSLQELREAFGILQRLKLVEKKGGRWVKKEDGFQTAPETASLSVRNFHRQMGERALKSLDKDDPQSRHFIGLTIALSEQEFRELKQRLFEHLLSLNEKYTPKRQSKKRNKIYQINIQAFPLLETE